jgi:hypothetical protein
MQIKPNYMYSVNFSSNNGYVSLNCLISNFRILQYKLNAMPQVIDISNKKNTKKADIPTTKKVSVKAKTKFQEEWEKGISVEELRNNLLKKVHTRWNEKLALTKK